MIKNYLFTSFVVYFGYFRKLMTLDRAKTLLWGFSVPFSLFVLVENSSNRDDSRGFTKIIFFIHWTPGSDSPSVTGPISKKNRKTIRARSFPKIPAILELSSKKSKMWLLTSLSCRGYHRLHGCSLLRGESWHNHTTDPKINVLGFYST